MQAPTLYDLSGLVRGDRKSQALARVVFRVGGIVGAIGMIAGLAYLKYRGSSALAVAVIIVGIVFVVGAGALIRLTNLWIQSVQVDDSRLDFRLSNGQGKSLLWSDPRLQLYIWDRTHLSRKPSRPPPSDYYLGAIPANVAGYISRDLYEAVLSRARQLGLLVQANVWAAGANAGATRTVVSQPLRPR